MKRKSFLTFTLITLIVITYIFITIDKDKNFIATSINQKWNIPFENVKVEEKSNNNIEIKKNNNGLFYNVNLEKPGDYYTISFDLSNNGLYDAKIDYIDITKLTISQQKYLDYKVLYLDGTEIKKGDIIKSNSKKTIKITINFKEDITAEDLPVDQENLNLGLNINLVPAE